MSTVVEPAKAEQPWESDPWRYGWRHMDEELPDGTILEKRIPLTEEDVLHPQEGDFIMVNPAHEQDCDVLKHALRSRLKDKLGVIVLADCLVDWGVAGIKPHCPDAVVIEGVDEWNPVLGIFVIAEHQARPVLVVEITSPSTRKNDLGVKVDHYYQVGVPLYVIVDTPVVNKVRTMRIIGRQATESGYVFMPLDARGRLWLEPVGLWLDSEGGQLVCTDAQGKRLGDYLEMERDADIAQHYAENARQQAEAVRQKIEAADQRAETARRQTETAAALAEAALAHADAEKARADALENRLLELEAELRKRDNPPT